MLARQRAPFGGLLAGLGHQQADDGAEDAVLGGLVRVVLRAWSGRGGFGEQAVQALAQAFFCGEVDPQHVCLAEQRFRRDLFDFIDITGEFFAVDNDAVDVEIVRGAQFETDSASAYGDAVGRNAVAVDGGGGARRSGDAEPDRMIPGGAGLA